MTEPQFRILPKDEWHKLVPVFAEFMCRFPLEGNIVVGEINGEIVSFQCVHKVVHLGPVYVAPEFRGKGIWPKMQAFAERQLPAPHDYYYQFGTELNDSRLKQLGLKWLGWKVMGKRVK